MILTLPENERDELVRLHRENIEWENCSDE